VAESPRRTEMSAIKKIHSSGTLPDPSQAERNAIAMASEKSRRRRPAFVLGLNRAVKDKTGVLHIGSSHTDHTGWVARLLETFGTSSDHFTAHQLKCIAGAFSDSKGKIDHEAMEALAAVLDGAEPRNEIEAMLIIQMATTHTLVMKLTGRVYRVGGDTTVAALDSISVALSRLHRAFAMQVDALASLRRGGRQKVTVEHVHVHPGAQAVVGNVTTGGTEKRGQQPYAISDGRDDSTLWREDSQREAVPLLAGDGQTAVSDARRRAGNGSPMRRAKRKLPARQTHPRGNGGT